MNKSEYRRAFIMLRPAQAGYSGHARLERRTMTGSLYFIVNGPNQPGGLAAALVGQRGGSYYAAPLGPLRRDSRGQFTLAWTFDPRAIDGRPLEAYQLLAVARVDSDCRIVLTGNVDGAWPMDAAQVQEAVCALFRSDAPADDLPDPSSMDPALPDPSSMGSTLPESSSAEPVLTEPPSTGPAPEAPSEPILPDPGIVLELAQADVEAPDAVPVNADPPDVEAPDAEAVLTEPAPVEAVPEPITIETVPEAEGIAGEAAEPPAPKARIFTRMRAPAREPDDGGAPSDVPVPSPAEPAAPLGWRALSAMDRATPCAMPLEDGYAYVRVPLPTACGYGYCLLGARVDDDRVASVRVAIPGDYAATPPEGLEGSVWIGGADGGFWVRTVRCPGRPDRD